MELLAALGVLAVLAAALLPLVFHAVRIGRRTACMTNLRQLHLAAVRYAHERNGLLPDRQLWQHPTRLTHSMVPYLSLPDSGEPTGLTCREDDRSLRSIMDYRRTYSLNLYASGSHLGKPDAHATLVRVIGVPERLQNVRLPAQMAFFMDGARNEEGGASPSLSEGDLDRVTFPHQEQAAVVYLDGRVALYRRAALLSDPVRTAPFWGGER